MGMPCEVNSVLKLTPAQGYPAQLETNQRYSVQKEGYRIIPVDVPIPLVDEHWWAYADVKILKLTWEAGMTTIDFEVDRMYDAPLLTKR